MDVLSIHVCQRKLRNPSQLPGMVEAVVSGDCLPPIPIACDEDGSMSLDDGHHRLVAFWLAGVRELRRQDYLLLPKDRYRPRFGSVLDLLFRCVACHRNERACDGSGVGSVAGVAGSLADILVRKLQSGLKNFPKSLVPVLTIG